MAPVDVHRTVQRPQDASAAVGAETVGVLPRGGVRPLQRHRNLMKLQLAGLVKQDYWFNWEPAGRSLFGIALEGDEPTRDPSEGASKKPPSKGDRNTEAIAPVGARRSRRPGLLV